ncbi:MAG: ABC transporter ATP-binding protein [Gemmatimonadales bacterium]
MGDLIFEARDLSFRYPRSAEAAVTAVSAAIHEGELVGIVGPNGSGKSTLLRLFMGALAPTGGQALAFGQPAAKWKRRELARLVGVVSQREEPNFPLRVEQAVMFGRYAHLGPLGAPRARDVAAVARALEQCDVTHLRKRWLATLSGGEWQRVRVARALAQEPRALMLDEATANLDVRHEMEVFELIAALVAERHLGGVLVTHQVNLAARFVDRIIIMEGGRASAIGRPHEVLTREVLERVFRWPVALTSWNDVPQFVPLRKDENPVDDVP